MSSVLLVGFYEIIQGQRNRPLAQINKTFFISFLRLLIRGALVRFLLRPDWRHHAGQYQHRRCAPHIDTSSPEHYAS